MKRTTIFFILLCLVQAACYKNSNYNESNLAGYDTTAQMFIDTTSLLADSFHIAHVYVKLPYDADSTKTLVTYRTDLGIFVESGTQTVQIQAKQNIDSVKRIAFATLKSGTKTGIAHIQINLYTQYKILLDTFTNAYPQYMQLSANTLSVNPANDATGEVSFTCRLFRYQGSPSQLNPVTMSVLDFSSTTPLGQFRVYNNLSDPTGTTQFTWVLGDTLINGGSTNYVGVLHAIAKVASDAKGDSLSSVINLYSSIKQ